MAAPNAEIRLWFPEKVEPRKMWLRIGEILEGFDFHLCHSQYLIAGDEDIILEGDAVSWEVIFDWFYSRPDNLWFHAELTYPDLKTGEQLEWATLQLVSSRRGGLPLSGLKPPLEIGWLIELTFSQSAIEALGCEFFEREVIGLSKALFLEFDGIYGVAGVDHDHPKEIYAELEFARLMKEKELKSVPIIPDIWFYLLNKERYEASKPYLASLPIKRVEELPNGGALLLMNYPEFEEECE